MSGKTPKHYQVKQFKRYDLPSSSGVYLIYDDQEHIIYVGKASSLVQRLSSYFTGKNITDPKTVQMVSHAKSFRIIKTFTVKEALILEHNLIKKHMPKYNILLKDDKRYPYLWLDLDHAFPKLILVRGQKRKKGRYFGPYPNGYAARKTLKFIQSYFKLRNCHEAFFRLRSRPCLQHQIELCHAPCVQMITQEAYAEQVSQALMFLEGKTQHLVTLLQEKMVIAAEQEQYEKAAQYRDALNDLHETMNAQMVEFSDQDLDVMVGVKQGSYRGVEMILVRNGQVIDSYGVDLSDIAIHSWDDFWLTYLIGAKQLPMSGKKRRVLLDPITEPTSYFESHIQDLVCINPTRTIHQQWIEMARLNAKERMKTLVTDTALSVMLLPHGEERDIVSCVCLDVSHWQGSAAKASLVWVTGGKPEKRFYRHYNISDASAGDDYASMKEAVVKTLGLMRDHRLPTPDVWVIDGGVGQLKVAATLISEVIDAPWIVSIAKGPTRKAEHEVYWFWNDGDMISIEPPTAFKHVLQVTRDESHRFAIQKHRNAYAKQPLQSVLLNIEGVGSVLSERLLQIFGGLRGIKEAHVKDLQAVKGVSKALAEAIYHYFHIE